MNPKTLHRSIINDYKFYNAVCNTLMPILSDYSTCNHYFTWLLQKTMDDIMHDMDHLEVDWSNVKLNVSGDLSDVTGLVLNTSFSKEAIDKALDQTLDKVKSIFMAPNDVVRKNGLIESKAINAFIVTQICNSAGLVIDESELIVKLNFKYYLYFANQCLLQYTQYSLGDKTGISKSKDSDPKGLNFVMKGKRSLDGSLHNENSFTNVYVNMKGVNIFIGTIEERTSKNIVYSYESLPDGLNSIKILPFQTDHIMHSQN